MAAYKDVSALYRQALDSLIERLKPDTNILAIILEGSMAYDTVWEKSDIDIDIIVKDQQLKERHFNLVEHGVVFSAGLSSRTEYLSHVRKSLQGSMTHSLLRRSKLVFERDQSIRSLFEDIEGVGERDARLMLMNTHGGCIYALYKVQKWYLVREDPYYTYVWFLKLLEFLASFEVIRNHEVPMRENLQQALKLNPVFFEPLYYELMDQKKTMERMGAAIKAVEHYLNHHTMTAYAPLLDYLCERGEPVGESELERHFDKKMDTEGTFFFSMEWLLESKIIQKTSLPIHIIPKSRFTAEEAAYYYGGQ